MVRVDLALSLITPTCLAMRFHCSSNQMGVAVGVWVWVYVIQCD
jgi:hypothetical protein